MTTATISTNATPSYAGQKRILDADSHVMELPGWLAEHADARTREILRPLELGAAGAMADKAVAAADQRRATGAVVSDETIAQDLMGLKGWYAHGSSDGEDRGRVMDHLGFEAQLVFPTFAPVQFMGDDPELLHGGARALNRAMAAFCSSDRRLLAVAYVPWTDPTEVVAIAREAIAEGCAAIMVPSDPGHGLGPSHPNHNPLWELLEETGVPLVTHIGGGGRSLRPAFHNNGVVVTDWIGGGENLRSKDFMAVHANPSYFFGCLVMDGVLERFPGLRAASVEQGASWVPGWVRQLDIAQITFGKTEPVLRNLSMKPSEYVQRQLRFTPFPTEDVGWMIDQSGPDLFLFSSDYPHPEGGRNPIARFDACLENHSDEVREKFYFKNMEHLMGPVLAR
jgi:uncharacterized protein